MPVTICGPLQIHNVTTNAIVKFGDSSVLSPKDQSRVFAGSGAINSAFGVMTNTAVNSTNFIDPDGIDQPIVRNN
ncbi:spore germination protein [Neobacillus ginsengisoli]|uniref:Spore germination protein PF n=1 Tax=Neobacillus ginsengisoli TaxID=904295 RepID=A0ABT9Y2J4_9BACI|nr:spore germination protein [Neobacillus ginsengisoli]MDQ0201868.1 spore germination protein PF [Neobacillus ginsengisoli]